MHRVRHLTLVLGDQLDLNAAAFDRFDAAQNAVCMAEAHEESTHGWSSKQRICPELRFLFFFSCQATAKNVHLIACDGQHLIPVATPHRTAGPAIGSANHSAARR